MGAQRGWGSGSRAQSKCQRALGKAFSTLPTLSYPAWSAGQASIVLGGPSSREPCIINCSISFQLCLPYSHRMRANVQRWIPTGTLEPHLGDIALAWEQVLNQVGRYRGLGDYEE